jgi:tetratricopeptide (TPR) repeat protein
MAELKSAIDQQGGVFPAAHFQIGMLLARQADTNSALDSYQTAIKQSAGVYPEAYYQMGQAHVRSRDLASAVVAYRTAIEQRGGTYPEAHQDLGRVLYSKGELEAANEEYSIAVRQRSSGQLIADAAVARAAGNTSNDADQTLREDVAEELGTALRQAPPATDSGKSVAAPGQTAARSAPPPEPTAKLSRKK